MMDKAQYDNLRRKIEERRMVQVEAVEAEYLNAIKSLDTVWRLSTGEAPPNAVATTEAEGPGIAPKLGPIYYVRQVIHKRDTEFNIRDILDAINTAHPGAGITVDAVSSALNKLRSRGEIVQTRPGAGRLPAHYRRAGAPTTPPAQSSDPQLRLVGGQ